MMKPIFGVCAAIFMFSLALIGCSKTEVTQASAASSTSAGKTVLEASDCGNCHGGGKNAPDLTKLGATRDAAWIVAHVKNPKTHNPGSRMPAYEGKINEADLQALGSYLASLK
jgi:mono/diheme cytochrome c family protein